MIESLKTGIRYGVSVLNQPVVKEGVKNIAGAVTCIFGIVEAYDLCQIIRGRKISSDINENWPKWAVVAAKISILAAKISLVLSACVSRPGIYVISLLVGSIVTTGQLEKVFGPNTIFAINPYHPRHLLSIAAVILALPAIALSIGNGAYWLNKKVKPQPEITPKMQTSPLATFTDCQIQGIAFFNTMTSRPVLHLGNQLASALRI